MREPTINNPNSGFILLLVLIILLSLSISTIFTLTEIKQNLHTQSLITLSDLKHSHALSLLHTLENHPTCILPLTNLTAKSPDWWRSHGCSADRENIRYYYAYEFLETDACAITADHRNVAFYRLTIVSPAEHPRDTSIFLQSTIATVADTAETCNGKTHTVALGEQMLREL